MKRLAVIFAMLTAGTPLADASAAVRNPFWPIGYEGKTTPISPEVRAKPAPPPEPKKPSPEEVKQKELAAAEAATAKAKAEEEAKKKAAKAAAEVKAAKEKAEREAALRAIITDADWAKAGRALKVSMPFALREEDGKTRYSVKINGNVYVDGDYVSFTHDSARFTWRVTGLDGESKKLSLERVRARRGHFLPTEQEKWAPRGVFMPGCDGAFGSGFIVTTNGYLVTNNHVVYDRRRQKNAVKVMVRCGAKNSLYAAKIVKTDKEHDLALLKIEGRFRPVKMAKERETLSGTDVFALGFPDPTVQGYEVKLTKGVISANEGIHGKQHLYQMDASIQGGNSGGPLVDGKGSLVGVVVSKKNPFLYLLDGDVPQNVNYAVKQSYLLPLFENIQVCRDGIMYADAWDGKGGIEVDTVNSVATNSCVQIFSSFSR